MGYLFTLAGSILTLVGVTVWTITGEPTSTVFAGGIVCLLGLAMRIRENRGNGR